MYSHIKLSFLGGYQQPIGVKSYSWHTMRWKRKQSLMHHHLNPRFLNLVLEEPLFHVFPFIKHPIQHQGCELADELNKACYSKEHASEMHQARLDDDKAIRVFC